MTRLALVLVCGWLVCPPLHAQEQARGPDPPGSAAPVARFVEAFNRADEAAMAASFGPRAKAFDFFLGEERFAEARWLEGAWQYHGIHVPPGWSGRLEVLDRIASGPFVTQRERLTWTASDGRRGSMVRTVLYQARAGRIHRMWLLPDEPDRADVPEVATPTYPRGEGPLVWFDAGHWNTATPDGTLWSFAELLRRDGYRVRTWQAPFARPELDAADVLVIANAQPEPGEAAEGPLPVPSAFAAQEVQAIHDWVAEGGALLLVADHEPFAGAAAALAAAFGAEFHDGAARDTARAPGGGDVFRRADGTLRPHPITDGSSPAERVDSVRTFLGQAFRGEPSLDPILVLPPTMVLETPNAWPAATGREIRRRPVGGWLQAGARRFGEGSVALFGEAWMFRFLEEESERGAGAQNARLILNLLRWLSSPSG